MHFNVVWKSGLHRVNTSFYVEVSFFEKLGVHLKLHIARSLLFIFCCNIILKYNLYESNRNFSKMFESTTLNVSPVTRLLTNVASSRRDCPDMPFELQDTVVRRPI